MQIFFGLETRLSLITPLTPTPSPSSPAICKLASPTHSLLHCPSPLSWWLLLSPGFSDLPHSTGHRSGAVRQHEPAMPSASCAHAYIKSCFMSSDTPFNKAMRKKTQTPPMPLNAAEQSSLLLSPLQITGILSLIIRLNK